MSYFLSLLGNFDIIICFNMNYYFDIIYFDIINLRNMSDELDARRYVRYLCSRHKSCAPSLWDCHLLSQRIQSRHPWRKDHIENDILNQVFVVCFYNIVTCLTPSQSLKKVFENENSNEFCLFFLFRLIY